MLIDKIIQFKSFKQQIGGENRLEDGRYCIVYVKDEHIMHLVTQKNIPWLLSLFSTSRCQES